MYGFIRSAVELRGSSARKTSRSRQDGSTFSMPTTEISVSGRVRHIRPLPSDSTTTSEPVSATAKFAPEMPTVAVRNSCRRWARAAAASWAGSSVRPGGASSMVRRNSSPISARLRWIAGTRMWLGRSSPSWTMSSARSVSIAVMPTASSASLRPVSWVAIDLTLTTLSAPACRTRSATIALASAASLAQCTWPPALVTFSSRRTRYVPRLASVWSLIAFAAWRSCSQSSSSATAFARLVLIAVVAWVRLRRS